ncbi:MAG: type II toxin-antitoxin system RelE/ParE family toxin [Myxococcales bacterium]|nr:type II toxin-antitoxin system RelE/ParE family toxin [Myxococcales bacterium]
MKWEIEFFNDSVEEDAERLPKGIKAKFIKIAELVEKYGPNIGKPYVDTIKGKDCQGLFEMRPRGKEGIARAFFCTVVKQKIIILSVVIKKADKVKKSELETAKRRMREVKND